MLKKTAGVLVLALVLGFLYWKTAHLGMDRYHEAMTTMRQLKQVDAQWNVDILRSRMGFNNNYDPVADPLASIERLEIALGDIGAGLARWTLAPGARSASRAGFAKHLEEYKAMMSKKIALVDRFKAEHAVYRNSSRYLPVAVTNARQAIAQAKSSGADANGALAQSDALLGEILREALIYGQGMEERSAGMVLEHVRTVEAKNTLPPQVAELTLAATSHAKTLLTRQRAVSDSMAEIAAVNTLAQIDLVSEAYEGLYQDVLQEQAQYQRYLLVYALVVLLMLGVYIYRPAPQRTDTAEASAPPLSARAELRPAR